MSQNCFTSAALAKKPVSAKAAINQKSGEEPESEPEDPPEKKSPKKKCKPPAKKKK